MAKQNHKKILITSIIALCVIAMSILSFFIFKNKQTTAKSIHIALPTKALVPQKVTDLINTVSKQTQLPQGEMPSVATVSDVTKLPHNPFFTNAQNGDKVLIYSIAAKAYLYRPSTGEIIQDSPVEIVNGSSDIASSSGVSSSPSAQTTPVLKIQY